ncbi:DUF4326 domain-containing protein [Methylosinus sp. H3A]|uniref:DUF4326 domain-containing protein n=1 Tax=Methylosinus sp. H3A TaxID=2785786 RepID=UPI0018C2F564|nr:DUF4326 domain-containing protein [Methylosinus sp. H3A]MBG0808082.1 DUF4326 domain-containing protein [Methylosinus sp. H3A]
MNARDSRRAFPDRDASPAAAAPDQNRAPSGSVRLGNKRKGAAAKPRPGETVVDIDRCNPILGNPFILQNHRDDARRAEVIKLYKKKYDADIARGGPMSAATEKLAERVRAGERLILMCWCHGAPLDKPCHGDLIKAQIERILTFTCV